MIKLKKILKESEGLSRGEKFGLEEVGEQIVQTHKRLNDMLFKYMNGLKKYHRNHKKNPELAEKIYNLWNHIKGNYYYTTKQAAGRYMIPFEKQYKALVSEGKLSEAIGKGMKWEDLKSGTSIEFTGGTTYVVTKIDKNKLDMSLKRRGKTGGGLFAGRAKLDKSQFESQVKVGLIKYLVNTNPRG